MEHHPYAELFPMIGEEALQELADDIKDNGQRLPITLDQKDRIIDGRNRYKACEMAGVEPVYDKREFATDLDVAKFVASMNIQRRHLTVSERAMIAEQMANMKRGGDRPSKNDSNFDHLNLGSRNNEPSTPSISIPEAAKIMGVSKASVENARKTRKKGTAKVQEAVKNGDIPVSVAARIADLPAEEQDEAVESNGRTNHRTPKPKSTKPKLMVSNGDTFTEMVDKVKKLGSVSHKKFQEALGGVTNQRWFMICVKNIHYLEVRDYGGEIELIVNEEEKEIMTAIRRRIERAQHLMTTSNRFKFDYDQIKKAIQDIYDLTTLAAEPKSRSKRK